MAVNQLAPSAEDNRELFDAIKGLYILDTGMRTLGQLARSLPPKMMPYLQPWLGRGQFLDRFLNRLPTITIREGTRVKIILTDDLALPAYQPKGE